MSLGWKHTYTQKRKNSSTVLLKKYAPTNLTIQNFLIFFFGKGGGAKKRRLFVLKNNVIFNELMNGDSDMYSNFQFIIVTFVF